MFFLISKLVLTLFRIGHFGAAHGWGSKKTPFPKICHTYPTMMKLGTFILYLKKIQKYINHVTHPLSSADISILLPEFGKFCYIKKYRYRLYFYTLFLILLTFLSLERFINKHGYNFDDISKNGWSRPS